MAFFREVSSRGFFVSSVLGYEAIFMRLPAKIARGLNTPNALCLSSFDAITHRFDDDSEIRSITREEVIQLVITLSSQEIESWDAQLIDEVFSSTDPKGALLFPFGRLGLSSS